jgi:hypothetical protein
LDIRLLNPIYFARTISLSIADTNPNQTQKKKKDISTNPVHRKKVGSDTGTEVVVVGTYVVVVLAVVLVVDGSGRQSPYHWL